MSYSEDTLKKKVYHSPMYLKQRCLNYFNTLGFSRLEAEATLDSLIYSDQRNVTSHGMNRIFSGFIKKLVKENLCEPGREPTIVREHDGYFLFDGNYSIGYYGVKQILNKLIAEHSQRNYIFCNIKNLYPSNCLTEYAEKLCDEGYICYITSKSPNRVLAPINNNKKIKYAKPIVGTNAYAWGFPGKNKKHIIFDATMAASTNGEVLKPLDQFEKTFNPDSFLTRTFQKPGKLTDLFSENGIFDGYILPFGSDKNYKGFGNLVIAELFDILQHDNNTDASTTIIAIKIADLGNYKDRAEKFRQNVHESLVHEDNEHARLPLQEKLWSEEEVLKGYEEKILALSENEAIVDLDFPLVEAPILEAPSGRKIAANTPGGEILTSIRSGKQVLAYGAGTPFRTLLLKQLGIDTIWISSFELSALLGEQDDESIGFHGTNFFVQHIIKKQPSAKLVIDCDTGWTNDELLLAQYFRTWKSSIAVAVVQNLKTGLKDNSFLDLNEDCLETPEIVAKKLNIIGKECSNSLVCIRLENFIVGQSVDQTIQYVCDIWENGGRFDFVVMHNKQDTLEPLEEFSRKFYEVMPKELFLLAIPTAYIKQPDLLQELEKTKHRLVVFANYALRSEYKTLADNYKKLVQGKYSEVHSDVAPMSNIFELLSNKNENSITMDNYNKILDKVKTDAVRQVASELVKKMEVKQEKIPNLLNRLLSGDVPNSGEFFEEWGRSDYDLVNLPDHKKLMMELKENLFNNSTDVILDIGSGTGEALEYIDQADTVVCMDRSQSMLVKLEKRINDFSFPIQLVCENILNYDSTQQFDKIFAIMSLHHIPHNEKQMSINKIASLLKPGGKLFLGETFFDTTEINTETVVNNIAEWYTRKINNCLQNKCYGHALRDVEILRRILFQKGEYMISLRMWKSLFENAGLKIVKSNITSPSINYGYLLVEKAKK